MLSCLLPYLNWLVLKLKHAPHFHNTRADQDLSFLGCSQICCRITGKYQEHAWVHYHIIKWNITTSSVCEEWYGSSYTAVRYKTWDNNSHMVLFMKVALPDLVWVLLQNRRPPGFQVPHHYGVSLSEYHIAVWYATQTLHSSRVCDSLLSYTSATRQLKPNFTTPM